MFALAGINKDNLYNALRQMGKKHLKSQLRDDWSDDNPTRNYCYVIAELVFRYYAPDGSASYSLVIDGDIAKHYFVKWPDGTIVDLAVEQFDFMPDYTKAKRRGFMAPSPSKRTRLLKDLLDEFV